VHLVWALFQQFQCKNGNSAVVKNEEYYTKGLQATDN